MVIKIRDIGCKYADVTFDDVSIGTFDAEELRQLGYDLGEALDDIKSMADRFDPPEEE